MAAVNRRPTNAMLAEAEQVGQSHLNSLTDAIQKLHLRYKTNVEKVDAFRTMQDEKRKEEKNSKVNPTRVSDQKFYELPEGCDVHEEKTMAYVRIVFMKVNEVDTVKEVYTAKAFIQAKWREPALDGISPTTSVIDYTKLWKPLLFIENIIGGDRGKEELTWLLDKSGQAWVFERRLLKGVFAETLELYDFPFDVQELSIIVSSERTSLELDLEADPDEQCGISTPPFEQQGEWDLFRHVDTEKMAIVQGYGGSSPKSYPTFSCICKASRRPDYFYWNIFIVLYFINSLSFTTFCVEPNKAQFRLALSFTLVLTTIQFKFVINRCVPKVSYLTYLDKYVLGSLVMIISSCVWHSGIQQIMKNYPHLMAKELGWLTIDKKVCMSLLCVYVLYHTVFILGLYWYACAKRREMRELDSEFLMKKAKLETSRRGTEDIFGNLYQ